MKPLYQRADFPSYRMNRKSFESRLIYPCTPAWVEALGYLLGYCLDKHDLELHAGCFNYNHEHLDVGHPVYEGATVQARYSALMQDFHFLWWQMLVANASWSGPAYTRLERTHQGPILDAEEYWRAICYDTAQAVKAGLFDRTEKDPSLVFLPKHVLEPRVFTRNHLIDSIDPDKTRFPEETISIQLGIPRILSHLTREKYAETFATRLTEYEDKVGPAKVHPTQKQLSRLRSKPIGQVLGKDHLTHHTRGHKPPPKSPRRFRPVYTSSEEIRRAYKLEENTFLDDHRDAVQATRRSKTLMMFPAGTYGWRKTLNVPIRAPDSTAWAGQPLWWPD